MDMMGSICVNTSYMDTYADTSSSDFMELRDMVFMNLYSYVTCGVNGFAALSIESAMQVKFSLLP